MPYGTGADTLQTVPAQNFVTDPAAFFAQTVPNVLTIASQADAGQGTFDTVQLPQSGIVSKLRVAFVGSLTVAGGAATPSHRYPYALLDDLKLSANGQNDLISVDGNTLKTHTLLRYPSYTDTTDTFPIAGGGGTIANGTYAVHLTYDVPIAMDDTSNVGSLYAQSSATNLTLRRATALATDLFSAIPGTVTWSGTWIVQEIMYEIPFDAEGRQILPDLSRLHGMNQFGVPFTNTGDVIVPLIRTEGQLSRLMFRVETAANTPASIQPSAAAANRIDAVRLQYAGNQRPLEYLPASFLATINNEHYGEVLPYNYGVLDFVRENPLRDALMMQGVTNLELVVTINSAAVVTAGNVTVMQETLF